MQNNGIPLYVTDTHSLIWYLTDSAKLSLNGEGSKTSLTRQKDYTLFLLKRLKI